MRSLAGGGDIDSQFESSLDEDSRPLCGGIMRDGSVDRRAGSHREGRLGLAISEITKPWTGDLDGMTERRLIRVLTAFSKTQYFIDRGTPGGPPTIRDGCSKTS